MLFEVASTTGPMVQEHVIVFAPFRMDTMHGRLWHSTQAILATISTDNNRPEIRYGRLLVFRKTANKPAGGCDAPDLGALCIPGYIVVGW